MLSTTIISEDDSADDLVAVFGSKNRKDSEMQDIFNLFYKE
jgi:hypothetical protein